jgi:hypothetical protein
VFEKLFRRNRTLDIDSLIFDIAEYKRSSDYEAFFKLLPDRVFFLRVDPQSTNAIPRGSPYRIKSTDALKATGLANMQGLTLLPLYTSSGDPRLHGSYAEIDGLEALRMALRTSGIDGVLFQNKEQSWLVLTMAQINQVLAKQD